MGQRLWARHALTRVRHKTESLVRASLRDLPKATTFQVTYSPQYNPNLLHLPWISDDKSHILYKELKKKTDGRAAGSTNFFWCIVPAANISGKRTIRSWARRRVEEAFKKALGESGYQTNGQSIERVDGIAEYDLKGSMRIMLNQKAVSATKELLDQEALTLVDYLVAPQTRHMSGEALSVEKVVADHPQPRPTYVRYVSFEEETPRKMAAAG